MGDAWLTICRSGGGGLRLGRFWCHRFGQQRPALGSGKAFGQVLPEKAGHGLAQRDGLSFYRIAGSGRGECFALGHGEAAAATLGLMTCDGGFGWHGEAVKDASLWTYDKSSQVVRFAQIQGFVTNRVKKVVAYSADGNAVASTSVSRNVYSIPSSDLSAIVVTRIAALDARGAALFQKAVPSRESFLALS